MFEDIRLQHLIKIQNLNKMVWYTEAIFIRLDKCLTLEGEKQISLKQKKETRQFSKVNISNAFAYIKYVNFSILED